TSLPVFVTNVYDEKGKLMTGATPEAMIAMLEGLGVSALGMNCSLGPDKMLPLIERFKDNASVPVIVNPNAGLPVVKDGKTVFTTDAEEFSDFMVKMAQRGACILGGCCGTTPEYIAKTVEKTIGIEYKLPEFKDKTVISSYTNAVEVKDKPILIGERINPTGKPKLKEALRDKNLSYILNEGIAQAEKGAHILDVNVGLPEIDEKEMMKEVVFALQSVTDLPLQLDSNNPSVLEGAMRIYAGKPLINSVNGEKESMDSIFPLVKKYGGSVIALTMDKEGIPKTAAERAKIAKRIVDYAMGYGIDKKDIIVDPLALTVSSDPESARVTLDAIELISKMGIKTSLGVSNISFGLPMRDKINAAFFSSALLKGLNMAIMNPFSEKMMDAYFAHNVLMGFDEGCLNYIGYAGNGTEETVKAQKADLKYAIIKGLKEEAVISAKELLKTNKPLDVINNYIIPALNQTGADFEAGKVFLPQLLMSAEASGKAFDEVKALMPKGEETGKAIILATVKGDIHDIGKNIVKVIHESYGYKVYDLGKDVEPERILECVKKTNCRLVGLSALMTTTVPAMEETIRVLKNYDQNIKVVVGGAVLNEDYAQMINASFYGKDAMESVRYTENYYTEAEL
ncbi:MAG: dihydropteroate synthase, partial [Clostridia bacterium]|nr:dihydropteroate synthase [Clostridia bacterium]